MTMKKALAVLMVAVMLMASFSILGSAAGTYTIVEGPIKTAYTDLEHFIPQGLKITDGSKVIEYSPVDDAWAFQPGLDELLSTGGFDADGNEILEKEIKVFYNNEYVDTITVDVDHVLGEITCLGDAGHGQYCLGCGKVHNYEEHTINDWIPNDDGGLFVAQTQTGVCEICNGSVTEAIPGSEKFVTIFDSEAMTETESTIVFYLYNILVSLIQMLVGIK